MSDEPREVRRFTVDGFAEEQTAAGTERVCSAYVEVEWLPFLGPTAMLLARKIDGMLSTSGRHALDVHRLAQDLGVIPDEVIAACHRLSRYGLAEWADRDPTLRMRRHWPHVPEAIKTSVHREALMSLPDVGRERVEVPK